MELEEQIIDYLAIHGNTRKDDLMEFGTQRLRLSSEVVNQALEKMMKERRIGKVVHKRLKTRAVYVFLRDPILRDLQQILANSSDPNENDEKASSEETHRIVEEARRIAQQSVKDKLSGSGRTRSSSPRTHRNQ